MAVDAASTVLLRPMGTHHVVRVHALAMRAFADLDRRQPSPRQEHRVPEKDPAVARFRYEHLIDTDPGGCWVATTHDDPETIIGAVAALERDGVWGLSLLVVEPGRQSAGVGGALLRRALGYADGGPSGGIILASTDTRALRVYASAGFALHPTWEFVGPPDRAALAPFLDAEPGLRVIDPATPGDADRDVVDRVSRAVRGASYAREIDTWHALGCRIAVVADRGFAVANQGNVRTLAATDDAAAQALLAHAVLSTPDGFAAEIEWVTSAQQHWVLPVALAARLDTFTGGAVCLRGDLDGAPLSCWLPGGAYL